MLRYDNANDAHSIVRHHRHYCSEVTGMNSSTFRHTSRNFLTRRDHT
ncbi:hypothetical protein [Haloquadratum walsbyi]